jgi:selenocysteine-specific elongation factor
MRALVVGTAGHIDHGKSSLVRALTGIDPDRLKEEKARGITIELGFAHTRIGETQLAFVDVPGHERFVRTMLAGAGGIDCVMLVVAADESVMPQTREHFDICRLLHVPSGLVVITKADLVDADTLALVKLEVEELVAGSFLQGAPIVPVSAQTGTGLDTLSDALVAIAAGAPPRGSGGAVRLPIDRVFSMRGFGTIVTGTLTSGRIATDDELVLLPCERRAKVRGLQVHGAPAAAADAGHRVAVNLGGVDVADVPRGDTLVTPGSLQATRRADVVVEVLSGPKALRHGARLHAHHGTTEALARVSLAGPGRAELLPGSRGLARLRFETPMVLTRGDRLVLRAYSPPVTIAGARVLDPEPGRTSIRTAAAVARLQALHSTDASRVVEQMIVEAGKAGLPVGALEWRAGVPRAERERLAASLVNAGSAVRVGDRLLSAPLVAALAAALLDAVAAAHRADPVSGGLPREEPRARLFGRAAVGLFESVVARLAAEGRLVARDRLALPTHTGRLSDGDQQAQDQVVEAYRTAGLTPPDTAAISAATGIAPALVDKITALLVRQKVLVRLDTVIFHHDALQTLKRDVVALKTGAPGGAATVDVAAFKDRFGVTRKFAIPLLEYLDRERVTRRVGTTRTVL